MDDEYHFWHTSKKDWFELKERARELRSNMPPAEVILWQHLRDNQLGAKFNRQKVIGRCIIDFYCAKSKVIVEVDGDTHVASQDEKRDRWLANSGFTVLRFQNDDVYHRLEGVVEAIVEALSSPRKQA